MIPFHHHRISLNAVGRHLADFRSTHELVAVIADAMEAHEYAHHEAGIIHRDISAGNIIITKQGGGILIDWDLCTNLNGQRKPALHPDRMGTWQFVSAALLDHISAPLPVADRYRSAADDRESALYVLLWNVLRYTKHSQLKDLGMYMASYDQAMADRGDTQKLLFLGLGYSTLRFDNHPHLHKLINELRRTFYARYEEVPPDGMLEILSSPAYANIPENYAVRKRNLDNRKWLVETFRRYLQLDEWPEADCANLDNFRAGGSTWMRTEALGQYEHQPVPRW